MNTNNLTILPAVEALLKKEKQRDFFSLRLSIDETLQALDNEYAERSLTTADILCCQENHILTLLWGLGEALTLLTEIESSGDR